jgi:HK97 family phage portal protein
MGAMDLATNPKQRESIENSLKEKHRGSKNAHNSIILPPGFKLSQGTTRFSQEQSQFIQTRIQFTEEVAQIYNLPLSKMRIKTDGNSYNSQEQANIEYVTDCLVPFSQGFKEEDNRKLFRDSEKGKIRLRVQFEGRLKGDMKTQGEFIDKMVKNGVYSVNDALGFLGMDAIGEEGNNRYIQSNQMKLGQTPIENGQENN